MTTDVRSIPDAVCPTNGCETCVSMCKTKPCWPTVEDAQRLIEAGYGDKLMIDRSISGPCETYVLSPATVAYTFGETRRSGQCIFLTDDEKCALHDLDLKPTEGRLADCQDESKNDGLQGQVAKTWLTSEGVGLIEMFERERGVNRNDVPRQRVIVTTLDGGTQTFETALWRREWEPVDDKPLKNFLIIDSQVDPPPGSKREILAIFADWAGFRVESS